MGRTSSKRSSSKRKSSKLHSEGRKKKKNTTKSKKLRSRKDYSSSCSDDSRSLISISTASSEDEHSRSRSRSRRKSESKGSKKRGRERSSTKSDKVSKIKKPQKKKLRREPSSTSLSSDSRSCSIDSVPSDTKKKPRKKRREKEHSIASITSDSHSCDEDREADSRKGRNKEKSKEEENLSKTKSLKVRSRSRSPYDRYNYGIDSNVPIIPASNSSRRLRSVITVVKPSEDEEREGDRDGFREEMMHDHKAHPSFRSNETTDGDNNENLDYCADDVETLKRDESSLSDLKSGVVMRGGDGGTITAGNEIVREEVSPVLPNPENDLESILRLKALENMIKYKGAQLEKLKAPTKLRGSNVVEQSRIPVTVKSETNTMPKKTQKANLVLAKNVVNESSAITSRSVQAASKDDEKDKNVRKSSVVEPSSIPKKIQNASSLVIESNLGNKSAPTHESLGLVSENGGRDVVIKSSISEPINNIPLKSQNEKSSVAESSLKNKVAITSASLGHAIKKDEHDSNVSKSSISEPSSSLQPKSEENSSKERQSTTDKDGSQFEQKTMSVMRGGEMVEVSYKVYIPKKAPALARRALRR